MSLPLRRIQMTLVSLAARKLTAKQRSAKLAAAFPNGVRCQKCLQFGHWSYECKEKRKYVHRTSRTKQLKKRIAEKNEVNASSNTAEGRLEDKKHNAVAKSKRVKRTRSSSGSSGSSSDNTSSDSNETGSSDSDENSSADSSSSGSNSESSSSGSGSDSSDSESSESSSSNTSSSDEGPNKKKRKRCTSSSSNNDEHDI